MDLFDNIGPLDYRYYGRDAKIFELLRPFLSENARIKYQAKVEAALAKALAKKGICPEEIAEEIEKASLLVTAEEVYAEEDKIKHDVRALANCIRAKVSAKAKPFVHFSATSYDIVDTANALRFKESAEQALLPALLALEKLFMEIALREKETLQIGRTHGQHAEPITFGFAIASYVSRLGGRIKAIETAKNNLCGKFSGAVGAYNASSLFFENPFEFENEIMRELGLKTSVSSTQIVEAEPLADLMHAIISCFGVLANFADDMRHLQRSEIGEVGETFDARQVGSSTMPQKRNPINFENVKSLWKEFMPRMNTVYLDQVSEHQRDLTNSASQRFLPEMVAALFLSAKRMEKTAGKMSVDRKNMEQNFAKSRGMLVAEPLYMLLAFHGHPDAHEEVRKLTLKAQAEKLSLQEIIKKEASLKPFLKKFSKKQLEIIENPEKYTGFAAKKTEKIIEHWKKELRIIKPNFYL
ncbi:MAG: lyase family protein [Candidatus ainarchaeum sp.]|nr:lyase family protein [Candidatus ainarchaeum sp.]